MKRVYRARQLVIPFVFGISTMIGAAHANTLVAHYKFDNTTGNAVADSSGNGHNGTLAGPSSTTGKSGQALQFDGIDDYVDVGSFDIWEGSLTLSAWIKADDFGIHDARIISKSTGTAEQDHYWMLSTIKNNGNKLRFRLKANGQTTTLIGNTNLPAGEWLHVAATYDGANMRLYVNGLEDGSVAKAGTISTDSAVGVRIGDNPASGQRNFKGTIDDMRIYSSALSVAELNALVNGDITPDTPTPDTPIPDNPTPDNSVLIVDDGFENGIEANWRAVPAFFKFSSKSREGNQSIHFLPDLNGGKRSELVLKNGKGRFHWGEEYWSGFSINVQVPVKGYQIISQHHSSPGVGADGEADWSVAAGGNSFTMKTTNGNFVFYTATNPDRVNQGPTGGGATRGSVSVTRPYTVNKWHDIVLHFRNATDSTGIMEVWMDGQQVVNVRGPTVYRFDMAGRPKSPVQHQKIGMYHGTAEPIGEILYDAFRIGGADASYQDVAPR